ncbi:MAG TPA: CHAD domain-containing protein [Steroidobacteraceae bacterium]|nr:CHAD domain-containing protein [Steroidobacteraceae bacterium]
MLLLVDGRHLAAMKRLSPDEDAAHRVLEITRAWIKEAVTELRKSTLDDEVVHSARKALKKARAGLRMLRPGLRDAEYRNANAALRDASRPLGELRDAKVLQDTLTDLMRRRRSRRRNGLNVARVSSLLKEHRRRVRRQILHDKRALAHSRHLLRVTLSRTKKWRLRKTNWKLLGPALEHAYRKARKARADAWTIGTPEALHEWRKQVKYLRYALEIAEPLWPAMLGVLAKQAHELSDELGDSHDLTALCEMTVAHPDAFANSSELDALLALSEHRQQELTGEANLLGARLLGERPPAFGARLEGYWRNWHQGAGLVHAH